MNHRIASFLVWVLWLAVACASKSGGTETATEQGTTNGTESGTASATGLVTSTGTESGTGAGTTESSFPAVLCDEEMCLEGEVCVNLGDECVEFEPAPEDECVDDGRDGCWHSVSTDWLCAKHPCADRPADEIEKCLADQFCESCGGSDGVWMDGRLQCDPQYCHCP